MKFRASSALAVLGVVAGLGLSTPSHANLLTNDWLTAALCREVPGAAVVDFEVVGGSDGTSSRRAVRVGYNALGHKAGLPTRLFTKEMEEYRRGRPQLIQTVRERGYRLARSASDLTMLEVVEAVDGPIRGQAPLSQIEGDGQLDRRLEMICDQSAEQIRKRLQKVRIAELAGKR